MIIIFTILIEAIQFLKLILGESPKTANPGLNSPPNSNHKESTKLEGSLNHTSHLNISGASPALVRSEETLRGRSSSFTKIKPEPRLSKSRARAATRSPGSEDEQPAASCQYVGDTSHSTINTTTGSVRRRTNNNNSTVNISQNVSKVQNILDGDLCPAPAPPASSGRLCMFLVAVLVAGCALLAVAVVQEAGLAWPALVPDTSADTAEHWRSVRRQFSAELGQLKPMFPNQSAATWRMVAATLKAPLHPLPDYPGVLLLAAPPSATPTARCLASHLVRISSAALAVPGITAPLASQLIIQASDLAAADPDSAKQQLTATLHDTLGSWGTAAILGLEQLQPTAALTLHAFADNSNAPYKQAALVLVLEVGEGGAECNPETRAERELGGAWAALGQDKLSALVSRVVVSVASVAAEDGAVC